MLIAAPLPGSATVAPPTCVTSWEAFARLWAPGPVRQFLAGVPGLSGCRVTYDYVDAVGPVERVAVAHAIAMLPSVQDAETFFDVGPGWLAFGTGPLLDGTALRTAAFPVESRASRDLADAVAVLESGDSNALAIRRGNIVHVLSFRPQAFDFGPEIVTQFIRLIAARSVAHPEARARSTEARTQVHLRVYTAREVTGFVPPDLDATAVRIGRIYGSLRRTPELVVAGWQVLENSAAFYPDEDIAELATVSRDCEVEVFYVAGTGNEGGWGWVPSTSVFVNAGLYGDRLRDVDIHARVLAHELGHLWGLDHFEDPANLMYVHGTGERLTVEQADVAAAYLEGWDASCK